MMRPLIPSACLLLLTALAGCGGSVATSEPPQPVSENPNHFTYHTADFSHAIHFAPAVDAPSPAELKQLQAFLNSSNARPEDKATVSGENSPMGQRRSAHVRDILQRAGLTVAPGVNVNLAPNTVGIVLSEQIVDEPPRCGDWPIFAGDAPSNAPSLFLGCALRNNLYHMAADKRDLAVGRTPGPGDAEPGMRAVQKYREGTPDKKKDDNSSQQGGGDSATGAASATGAMSNSGGGNGQ